MTNIGLTPAHDPGALMDRRVKNDIRFSHLVLNHVLSIECETCVGGGGLNNIKKLTN